MSKTKRALSDKKLKARMAEPIHVLLELEGMLEDGGFKPTIDRRGGDVSAFVQTPNLEPKLGAASIDEPAYAFVLRG